MKERVDSTKILREPSVNCPVQDAAVAEGVLKMDSADIKMEAKEEDGRTSAESRPPSRKISNGESDNSMAVKSEDNNNKRIKVEKRSDSNGKTENGKPGSVGTDSQKASPQTVVPQHPSSGGTTPALMTQHGLVTSLEPPFMQQQSELFVFSTRLANEAAESVRHGHCKSIMQYHMEHPNTKAFLQKNPLNVNSFRHSVQHGMMGSMKGQQGPSMIRMPSPSPANWGPHQIPGMEDPAMMDRRGMVPNGPYPPGPRMMAGWSGCNAPPGQGCNAPPGQGCNAPPGQGCNALHPHMHPSMGPGGYLHGNMMDMEAEMMLGGPLNTSNISSSQVPDENLTMEQRQHRSKGLAQLTKIHQMLMGDSGPQDRRQSHMGHDGPGMYPCGPRMMTPAQQQALMSQQQSMMSQGGMMSPHGINAQQHQHMMAHQGMSPYGPGCPPGMVPMGMNGKEQYQAQHDWYHIQREFYMEKQHHMQHMASGRGPHMEPGPPPSYYSSISQKHGGMSGPTSPNMNGMRMLMPPHGPHGPMGAGMDPDGLGMYGGPPEMCRQPHIGMESMQGMHGFPPHVMTPQGPVDPGFDPAMSGVISPGMVPGPGLGGRRLHGSMRQGHMIGPNGMMPGMKGPNQVTLHRAGNPEQFNPETMGGVVPPVAAPPSNSSKPPPSYAQAQKRKRGDDADDSYTKGNLQQTPSPTKIHYHLSQFEGQELTITKQLNSAYVAGNGGDETVGGSSGVSGNSSGHFNGHNNSPLHGPGSNKGPHSNSSQTSVHMANSPAGPSPHQGPATPHSTSHPSSVPSSGANMRLTHYDPAPLSNGVGSAPHTPNPKPSSMSNITSASLANLAKGVENLSNQMQQNMMQGGPFHSIQVQGQISSNSSSNSNNSNNSSSNTNSGSLTAAATSSSFSSSLSSHAGPTTSHPSSTLSVNNTFIATNMSISQVNMPNHPSMNNYVNMQMQNMSNESSHMNIPPCGMQHNMGTHMGPGMMGVGPRPGMPHHIVQSQNMMTSVGSMQGGPSPGIGPGPPLSSGPMTSGMNSIGLIPPHRPNSSSSMPATPPTLSKGQFTSPPLIHPQMTGPGSHPMPDVTSPSFPITSSSNSSVQIQQKGHNTIQYLPANPPSSHSSTAKHRSDMDYNMPRFPSPLHTMDGKNPSSTLQYFPNSSPTGSRPPVLSSALSAAAAMGPEFANQATIAMHQSASMMRSSSIPDIHAMQGGGPVMPPNSMGHMIPMDSSGHMGGPHMNGPDPLMIGPDTMMGMGSLGHMRPGHSPGSMRPLPPGMGPSSLECVSPIPGMSSYLNNGPSIEQAQAQAQAHAAMMMQGNIQIPVSSPHAHMPPVGGPSPHMTAMGPMPGTSLHGPMAPGGMPVSSMLGPSMPGLSPHGPPMPVQSPLGTMSGSMPGPSPHGPMSSSMQGMSPHGSMHGPSPHSSLAGPLPPHGHMGHMHGPGMPPGSLSRHPGMGGIRMVGPGMGMSGQYGMQYPGYQQDFYSSGPPRGHPRQMMPGMMGGPGQPYGMMTNMPGPS